MNVRKLLHHAADVKMIKYAMQGNILRVSSHDISNRANIIIGSITYGTVACDM